MIGFFVRNAEGDIAFACPPENPKIASFHYLREPRILMAELAAGGEESFTSEMAAELHEALTQASRILVAEMTEAGDIRREYWADLTAS